MLPSFLESIAALPSPSFVNRDDDEGAPAHDRNSEGLVTSTVFTTMVPLLDSHGEYSRKRIF